MSEELRAVVARVVKVERQNRRMKYVGIVILMLAGTAVLMGQAAPKPKSGDRQEIVLRGPGGKRQMILSATALGPSIVLRDMAGMPRAHLSVNGGVPKLDFRGPSSVTRAVFTIGPSTSHSKDYNTLHFWYFDENDTQRASVVVTEKASLLTLWDADGKKIWSAP